MSDDQNNLYRLSGGEWLPSALSVLFGEVKADPSKATENASKALALAESYAEKRKREEWHEHVFSIPVEFRLLNIHPAYDGNGHVTLVPREMHVTKLRCPCGEEVKRESNSDNDD